MMSEEEKKEEGQEPPISEEPEENFWEASSKREEEKPTITLLREIARIMEEMDLTEVSYEEEGIKLSLKRGITVQAVPQQTLPQLPVPQNGILEGEIASAGELATIGAFMVGVFHRAPEPNAEPYVEVGDRVSEGAPLCVIMAMKHLNEQKAEFDCEIVEILVEDTDRVEFDQPLFKVRRIS